MVEGDPYLTKEFYRQRARQRRQLRVMMRALPHLPAEDSPASISQQSTGLETLETEVALRAIADDLVAPVQSYLADEEKRQQVAALHRVRLHGAPWAEAADTSIANRLSDLAPPVGPPDDDHARDRVLRDAVALLQAADELAAQNP
jgi:hypothetical protein